MTEGIVKLWNVYCIQENAVFTTWSVEPPLYCPNNHDNREIDHMRTRCIKFLSEKKMKVENNITGYFQHNVEELDIPGGGGQNEISEHELKWPMDLYLWKMDIMPESSHKNDIIDIIVNPDTIIGTLTENAIIGNTSVNVGNESFGDFMTKGVDISLSDDINKQDLGRVTGFDNVNNTILFENALEYDFSTGTKLLINVHIVKNLILFQDVHTMHVASKGWSVRYVAANTPIIIKYRNNSGNSKKLYLVLEYNYE